MRNYEDPVENFREALRDAEHAIELAEIYRDEAKVSGFGDLQLVKTEIHHLACRARELPRQSVAIRESKSGESR